MSAENNKGSEKRNKEFYLIFKDIDPQEILQETFSCALNREILVHGRIYITENNLCFYSNLLGWSTTYFFTSFVWRDVAFDVITMYWKKSLSVANEAINLFSDDSQFKARYDEGKVAPLAMKEAQLNILLCPRVNVDKSIQKSHEKLVSAYLRGRNFEPANKSIFSNNNEIIIEKSLQFSKNAFFRIMMLKKDQIIIYLSFNFYRLLESLEIKQFFSVKPTTIKTEEVLSILLEKINFDSTKKKHNNNNKRSTTVRKIGKFVLIFSILLLVIVCFWYRLGSWVLARKMKQRLERRSHNSSNAERLFKQFL